MLAGSRPGVEVEKTPGTKPKWPTTPSFLQLPSLLDKNSLHKYTSPNQLHIPPTPSFLQLPSLLDKNSLHKYTSPNQLHIPPTPSFLQLPSLLDKNSLHKYTSPNQLHIPRSTYPPHHPTLHTIPHRNSHAAHTHRDMLVLSLQEVTRK